MQYTLTGFADEAGISIEDQMDVLAQNGIDHMETRNIDGKPILALTEEELLEIKRKMDTKNFRVSAIGSPIGKTLVTDDFGAVLASFDKAVRAAKIFGCRYIRGFSFYIPKNVVPEDYADEVIMRLGELVRIVAENDLVYALENESGIFTDIAERCLYVFERIASPHFRMAFDPANFINNRVQPYPKAYGMLKQYVDYFHIKDGTFENGQYINKPAGEGEADMAKLLREAFDGGFEGFLSIEPHLGYMTDLTDAQRFTRAADAIKKVLAGI